MVAMLAFGGTYAYFTATTTAKTATAKAATIKLTAGDTYTVTEENFLVTGDQIMSAVSYDPAGTTAKSIVIVHYVVSGFTNTVLEGWTELETGYYYQVINVTESESEGVVTATVDNTFKKDFVNAVTFTASDNWTDGEDASDEGIMGDDISVSIEAKAIQYRGLTLASGTSTDESPVADVAAAAKTALFG